jgi:hypothetical protein
MGPRVVERGGLKNARVSHGGRGAGAGGRRGDALISLDAEGGDPGAHACTSGARASAGELFRRVQCRARARRTVPT